MLCFQRSLRIISTVLPIVLPAIGRKERKARKTFWVFRNIAMGGWVRRVWEWINHGMALAGSVAELEKWWLSCLHFFSPYGFLKCFWASPFSPSSLLLLFKENLILWIINCIWVRGTTKFKLVYLKEVAYGVLHALPFPDVKKNPQSSLDIQWEGSPWL